MHNIRRKRFGFALHSGVLKIGAPIGYTGIYAKAYLHGLLVIFWFGLTFIPAFTIFSGTSARFIVYSLPFVSLFLWVMLFGRQLQYDHRFLLAVTLYCLLILVQFVLVQPPLYTDSWVNILRPIFYLAVFIPFLVYDDRSVKYLILIFMLTTVGLALVGKSESSGDFDLAESKGLLESGLAFPLGGVLLYCLMHKRKILGVLALILFLIAFKRIAFAALFVIGGIWLCNRLLRSVLALSERQLLFGWVALVAVGSVLVNLNYYDVFSSLIEITGSQKNVDEITMGRLREFQILQGQYGNQNLLHILFGNGPGDSTRQLVQVTIKYPLQVHNSFLLYYYDYGIIGFSWMMVVYFIIYSRNVFGMYLFIYNLILMITDTNFIHHYHQITYAVLILAAEQFIRDKHATSGRHLSAA